MAENVDAKPTDVLKLISKVRAISLFKRIPCRMGHDFHQRRLGECLRDMGFIEHGKIAIYSYSRGCASQKVQIRAFFLE